MKMTYPHAGTIPYAARAERAHLVVEELDECFDWCDDPEDVPVIPELLRDEL